MKKMFLYITALALTSLQSTAQVIDSMLQVYADQHPHQKAYVHFDKKLYRAGETIWFKAYLLEGNEPTVNSKSLYAELIDVNGKVAHRKVYPLIASSAAGSFQLPDDTTKGVFRFRAYTTWMLNFDTSFIFQKDIFVLNPKGKSKNEQRRLQQKPSILKFFPEGGDMVNGVKTLLAFKATDGSGMPVHINGKVTNAKGETIVSFKDEHDGMGAFHFKPEAEETYTAIWTDDYNKEYSTLLPKVKSEGVTLQLSDGLKRKEYVIERTQQVPDSWKRLNIIATINQQLFYKAVVPMRSLRNSSFIPLDKCPAGVLQVTLFSENWEPLAERISMVKNDSYVLPASLHTSEVNFSKRTRNSFEIEIADTSLTNLSVSVTDAVIGALAEEDNIISRMLLTGDIIGRVHNAAYYFSQADNATKHLDLVMLTHGWRRYNWKDVVQAKIPELKYTKENHIELQAKISGTPIKKDEHITAILQTKDSSRQMIVLQRTGNDTYSADGLIFYDTAKVYYSFKDKDLAERATVKFSNSLYQGPKTINMESVLLNSLQPKDSVVVERSNFLANEVIKYESSWKTKGNTLEDVKVKTKVKSRMEELDDAYAKGLFSGGRAFTYDMINDDRINVKDNVLQYLAGIVPGLQIINDNLVPEARWREQVTNLYLNELPVDILTMRDVPVEDIAYVKVFPPIFVGPFGDGAGGGIAVYTKKGVDAKKDIKGLQSSTVAGYSAYKEFYSPDYSIEDVITQTQSDYRTTLYWNPFVFLGASRKKMRIEFYNNDVSKAFKVVVEGTNELGKLVRIEKVIE
jgi:hypothetical protein